MGNDPVNYVDPSGTHWKKIGDVTAEEWQSNPTESFVSPDEVWISDVGMASWSGGSTEIPVSGQSRRGGGGGGGGGSWLDRYSLWFQRNLPGGRWWATTAGNGIYRAESTVFSNAAIASQSDGSLLTQSIALAIPAGFGLLFGGELVLGVGSAGSILSSAYSIGGSWLTYVAGGAGFFGAAAESPAGQEIAEEIETLEGEGSSAICNFFNTWCFPTGTPVATSEGNVTIESIRRGIEVWGYDLVASEWRLCRVLETFVNNYEGHSAFITISGETIESTSGHPFWVVRGDDLSRRRCPEHIRAPQGSTTVGR